MMMIKALKKAWGTRLVLLSSALGLAVAAEVVLTCMIPEWRTFFYGIMERKDASQFTMALWYFVGMVGFLGLAQSVKAWLAQSLGALIRVSLVKILFKRWVKSDMSADNYTQAMTVSAKCMLEDALEIGIEVLISAFIVAGMIMSMENGPILWAALAYTFGVSILALVFNRPLIYANKALQASEGALRETICSSANGNHKFTFKEDLTYSMECYARHIRVLLGYGSFYRMKSGLSVLIPYLILAGPYFAGIIGLGEFMGQVGAFELFVVNTTLLLGYYPKLMACRASYLLVDNFYKEINDDKHSL